jgi:demethylmenaquinone methyltransferase/2-methoxy-6-polyprenyl-1,4-benzoquinol methylase
MLRRVPHLARLAPVLADAAALPLADASCDGALCLDALHHFRDPRRALREVARVLRPGGRLVIEDLDARRGPVRALGRLEALFGEPGTFWTPPELAALVVGAGFTPTEVRVEGVALYLVAVCP